jgi:hypothetical protein
MLAPVNTGSLGLYKIKALKGDLLSIMPIGSMYQLLMVLLTCPTHTFTTHMGCEIYQ